MYIIYSTYFNEKGVRRYKFFDNWDEYNEFFFSPKKTIIKTKILVNRKEVN